MSNQYIVYNFCAEVQASKSKWQSLIASLTRSLAVAKRPNDVVKNFAVTQSHSRSFRIYTDE